LHERPYDEKLPYALVAVLYGKLGRAPLPDPSLSPAKFVPAGDPRSLDDLVKSAEAHARTGDPFAVYAALWQAIVRYPDTSRGWAEFARHLALRGAWSYCRTAASHALNNAKTIDAATVASLSAALSILADEGQLADLDWQNWVQKLTPTQRMRAPIVNLLLRSGDVEAASTLLPQVIKKRPKDARTWLIASRVAYEQERLADSYSYLRSALELDFPASLHEIVRVTSAAASLAAIELGKEDELADWVSETTIAYPEVNLLPARPSPEALLSAQRMRRVALELGLLSALLITQAKSGSVGIGNIFTSGFSLPTVLYSFVNARVVLPWLADFLRGGAC